MPQTQQRPSCFRAVEGYDGAMCIHVDMAAMARYVKYDSIAFTLQIFYK